MSTVDLQRAAAAHVSDPEMRLEVVVLPVSEVDRAKRFAEQVHLVTTGTYFLPNRTIKDLYDAMKDGRPLDPLKGFSDAVRDEGHLSPPPRRSTRRRRDPVREMLGMWLPRVLWISLRRRRAT